jgi:uncharacterized protein with GYD domain
VKDTTKRAQALNDLAKKFGATVTSTYWTIGQYDVVVIVRARRYGTYRTALSLGASGNVRTQTRRAFSADQMGQILGEMK